jgi:hypothetical protein
MDVSRMPKLAKVGVEGSNPFARSRIFSKVAKHDEPPRGGFVVSALKACPGVVGLSGSRLGSP